MNFNGSPFMGDTFLSTCKPWIFPLEQKKISITIHGLHSSREIANGYRNKLHNLMCQQRNMIIQERQINVGYKRKLRQIVT